MSTRPRGWVLLGLCAGVVGWTALAAPPASAHGFNSVVYVGLSQPAAHEYRAELNLEYDLLVYSVDKEQYTTGAAGWDDDFYDQAYEQAWKNPDDLPDAQSDVAMATALADFSAPVAAYLTKRFTVSAGDQPCAATLAPGVTVAERDPGYGPVPYAKVVLEYRCPADDRAPVVRSALFPDAEGFVKGTKTLVGFDLSSGAGQVILDQTTTVGSTGQTERQQFWEFFRTGFLHVLEGLDHLLFLVALVAGSRRLREVVLGATGFTLAHAVTVSLVALGAFTPASGFVEPVIALSIAAVALWHLVRLWQRKGHVDDLDTTRTGHFALDRDGWIRVGIIFAFGLVHGMGFAGALNIDGRSGWDQLLSLISFNLGIEAVQLCLVTLLFPPLMLLRRRSHTAWLWTTGLIASGVALMGTLWFVGRVTGWYDISSDLG